jgi:integrase
MQATPLCVQRGCGARPRLSPPVQAAWLFSAAQNGGRYLRPHRPQGPRHSISSDCRGRSRVGPSTASVYRPPRATVKAVGAQGTISCADDTDGADGLAPLSSGALVIRRRQCRPCPRSQPSFDKLLHLSNKSVTVRIGRRAISMREYLTEREVERLIEAAKHRSGHRDATAILVAYRHGLRASEIVALRWDDIDLTTGRLHVRRAKGGVASVHPISARKVGRCASSCAKHQRHPTSSSRNVARLFPQPDISAWWPGRAWPRNSPFSFIPTCCGTPAGQARQRRPRHSRHPSLSRAPLDHVHGPL